MKFIINIVKTFILISYVTNECLQPLSTSYWTILTTTEVCYGREVKYIDTYDEIDLLEKCSPYYKKENQRILDCFSTYKDDKMKDNRIGPFTFEENPLYLWKDRNLIPFYRALANHYIVHEENGPIQYVTFKINNNINFSLKLVNHSFDIWITNKDLLYVSDTVDSCFEDHFKGYLNLFLERNDTLIRCKSKTENDYKLFPILIAAFVFLFIVILVIIGIWFLKRRNNKHVDNEQSLNVEELGYLEPIQSNEHEDVGNVHEYVEIAPNNVSQQAVLYDYAYGLQKNPNSSAE